MINRREIGNRDKFSRRRIRSDILNNFYSEEFKIIENFNEIFGSLTAAQAFYEGALIISKNKKNDMGIFGSLVSLGDIYYKIGYFNASLEKLNLALEFLTNFQDSEQKLELELMVREKMERILYEVNDENGLYENNKRMMVIINHLKEKESLENIIDQRSTKKEEYNYRDKFEKSIRLLKQNKFEKALKNFNELLEYCLDSGRDLWAARTYEQIGMIKYLEKEYSEAKINYINALEIYEKLDRKDEMCDLNLKIGTILLFSKKLKEGVKYFKASLDLSREISNRELELESLQRLAFIYKKLNMPNYAYSFYHKALLLYKETDDIAGINKCLFSMGNVLMELKQYNKALEKFIEYLEFLNTYYQRDEMREAKINTINKIENIAMKLGKTDEIKKARKIKREIYSGL
jgi:tetratricopeptide (TPR) repeat protein